MPHHLYQYVGPDHLRSLRRESHCTRPESAGDVRSWAAGQLPAGKLSGSVTATFIVDSTGSLWIADRRSEHVACADGGPVMAAGEITFEMNGKDVEAAEVSNQSTGFCPEPDCWPAVAAAMDRIGLSRPDDFTASFVFRKCAACSGINLIKDGVFECDGCGSDLPQEWNF